MTEQVATPAAGAANPAPPPLEVVQDVKPAPSATTDFPVATNQPPAVSGEAEQAGQEGEVIPPETPEQSSVRKERSRLRYEQMHARMVDAEQRAAFAVAELQRSRAAPPPNPDQFVDNPEEYTAQRAAYVLRQQQAQDRAAEAQYMGLVAEQARAEAFSARCDEIRTRAPDFDQVFHATPIHPTAAPLIAQHPTGPEVAYYLGKNPQTAYALYQAFEQNPVAASFHLAQIASSIGVPNRSTTRAPAPPATLPGSAGLQARDPSTMTMKEYEAWRKGGGG